MARAGVEAGCTEALFTLGDKPELLYDQAKHEVCLILCLCRTVYRSAGFSPVDDIRGFKQLRAMHCEGCFLNLKS